MKVISAGHDFTRKLAVALGLDPDATPITSITSITIRSAIGDVVRVEVGMLVDQDNAEKIEEIVKHYRLLPELVDDGDL